MGQSQQLGRRGEQVAGEYLTARGMVVVARNWRCRHGEIDIIAREGATLVFCEVKTRSGLGFGAPLGAITPSKRARLRRLVGQYLADTGGHMGPVRIDAVGILWPRSGPPTVEHLRDVA